MKNHSVGRATRSAGRPAIGTPDARSPERHPAGRQCAQEDCGTVLSIYNETDHCSQHKQRTDVKTRGVLRKKAAS